MSDRLDELVGRLAMMPPDRSLDGLELEVGRTMARRRAEARASHALTPIRLASVGLAMAMGVTAGGVAASAAIDTSAQGGGMMAGVELAPSTLLGAHG